MTVEDLQHKPEEVHQPRKENKMLALFREAKALVQRESRTGDSKYTNNLNAFKAEISEQNNKTIQVGEPEESQPKVEKLVRQAGAKRFEGKEAEAEALDFEAMVHEANAQGRKLESFEETPMVTDRFNNPSVTIPEVKKSAVEVDKTPTG